MKRARLIVGILSFLLISFLSVQTNAAPYVIDDSQNGATSYWGYNSHGYGDVIGYPDFEITNMTVTWSGSQLTVRLTAPANGYFYKYNHGVNLPYSYGPGDLIIDSQGWTVSGTGHHENDSFSMGEGWDYAVSFADKKLYKINGFNATNASAGTWREGQAWTGVYDGSALSSATLTLTDTYLEFVFDASALNLKDGFGLHWAMQCGNDTLEGGVPVPEPATILLLGLGLVGLGVSSRKFRG